MARRRPEQTERQGAQAALRHAMLSIINPHAVARVCQYGGVANGCDYCLSGVRRVDRLMGLLSVPEQVAAGKRLLAGRTAADDDVVDADAGVVVRDLAAVP